MYQNDSYRANVLKTSQNVFFRPAAQITGPNGKRTNRNKPQKAFKVFKKRFCIKPAFSHKRLCLQFWLQGVQSLQGKWIRSLKVMGCICKCICFLMKPRRFVCDLQTRLRSKPRQILKYFCKVGQDSAECCQKSIDFLLNICYIDDESHGKFF